MNKGLAFVLLTLLASGCHQRHSYSKKHHYIQEVSKLPQEGKFFQVQQGENNEKVFILIVPKRHKIKGS